MPHPLIELGGEGNPVVLLPANGFPPETYQPALASLFEQNRVGSLPPRAMWDDAGPPPATPEDWTPLAQDLLEGMGQHRLEPAVVVGHSFGGVAALLAAVRRRAAFRAVALLDPTILPPAILDGFAEERRRGLALSRPLVQGALTRRNHFDSEDEAFQYWRTRPLFGDWSDAMLRRYARAMLRPANGGYTLRWAREWEAHYYASVHAGIWQDLEGLDPGLPLLVVRGERSDTFVAEAARRFGARVPWAIERVIPGRGHLFPQSAPAETGAVLSEWLSSLPGA